jgi:A/G-specific adenine glycosylase
MLDKQIVEFRSTLGSWFKNDGRDYPWRRTEDPWHILVSEVMLQQTQVATVLNRGFYVNFLEKYPTPQSIAFAPEKDILSAWEGLGYYRRVRNLQKAARAICEDHDGKFPRDHAAILERRIIVCLQRRSTDRRRQCRSCSQPRL